MKIRLILLLVFCVNFSGCFDDTRQYETVYGSVNPVEDKVWICVSPTAKKYHSRKCHGLNRCTHTTEQISLFEAKNRYYTKCKICYKD
jgi:hypothetical protein